MRCLILTAICLLSYSSSRAEDAQLRARAFELVERARQVSATRQSAPVVNEMVVTFRTRDANGKMREGTYTRVFAGATGTREEFTLPDYHVVRLSLPDRIAFIGGSRVLPPELHEVLKLIPIQLWHLDQEDVVRDIRKENRKGLDAQCIDFDTIRGSEVFNNAMCFDSATGAEIYDRSGNMELENSEFFDFSGAKLPGHIMEYRNGILKTEIQVTRRIITEPISTDMFTPPATADVGMRCRTYSRPFGQSMPQPPGNGLPITNVVVHALIGFDGHVQSAAVEDSDRPELNEEALKVARTWTFTPAMCNGKPNTQGVSLVIRFQGR